MPYYDAQRHFEVTNRNAELPSCVDYKQDTSVFRNPDNVCARPRVVNPPYLKKEEPHSVSHAKWSDTITGSDVPHL